MHDEPKKARDLPFLLRYGERPDDETMIDGLEMEYYRDQRLNGMQLRMPFVAWDSHALLKEVAG